MPRAEKSGFRPLRWLRKAVLFFLLFTCALVVLFRFVPPPGTPLMLIRCVQQWAGGKPMHLDKHWRSLEDISPHLADAVVASEDQLFPHHWGFDWDAIHNAFSRNARRKHVLGAS